MDWAVIGVVLGALGLLWRQNADLGRRIDTLSADLGRRIDALAVDVKDVHRCVSRLEGRIDGWYDRASKPAPAPAD